MKISSKAATSEAKLQRTRRWILIERSFTMAAIVVVLFLGWSAISGMQKLFSENLSNPTQADPSSSNAAQLGLTNVLVALDKGGYWTMAGWQWEVGVVNVKADDVDRRLDQLTHCELPINLSDQELKTIRRLMDALHALSVEHVQHDDRNEYRIDRVDTKFRAISIGSGDGEILTSLGAAMRNPETAQWTVFELRSNPQRDPQCAPAQLEPPEFTSLLPLPKTTRQLCGRTDQAGHLIFELVDSPMRLSNLIEQWRRQGWEVSPFRPQRLMDERIGNLNDYQPSTSFLCEKHSELVHIWSIPSEQSDSALLAMMRISLGPSGSRK